MKKLTLIACVLAGLVSSCFADRISYTNITFNTVPQGAAIVVDGQFFGYSPVVLHVRLINGRIPRPILIDAVPTRPGQYRQHGSIGLWEKGPWAPETSITAYMYDRSGIHARAAAEGQSAGE